MHLNVIHSLVVAETKIDNGEDVDITKTMQDAAIEGFISGAVFGGMGRGAKSGSDLCKYTLIGVCTYNGTYTGGQAGIELSKGNKNLPHYTPVKVFYHFSEHIKSANQHLMLY